MSKSPGSGAFENDAAPPSAPPDQPSFDPIDAELADHLVTAAQRLQSQGVSNSEARQQAERKFGDIKTIARRCYWVQQGDQVMFRTAVIVLLVILCLALGVTALTSLRAQQQMAQQMAALAQQLKAVAERQQNQTPAAASVPAEPQPPQFFGRLFRSSPEQPAAQTPLKIIDVKDGSTVRTLTTDGEGKFDSGPLAGGDYSLVASTGVRLPGERTARFVQSAPIAAYPGVRVPELELNVAYPTARFVLETNRPLPRQQFGDRYVIESRLLLLVHSSQDRSRLWILEQQPPLAWPVYSISELAPAKDHSTNLISTGYRTGGGRVFYEILGSNDLQGDSLPQIITYLSQLPAGSVEIAAAILADVLPVDYQRPAIPVTRPKVVTDSNRHIFAAAMDWVHLLNSVSSNPPRSLRGSRGESAPTLENDAYFWFAKGLGNVWFLHLKQLAHPGEPAPPLRPFLIAPDWIQFSEGLTIHTEPGALARLQIEIPDDLERRIQELVDGTPDPDEFSKFTLGADRHLSDLARRFASQASGTEPRDDRPKHRGTPDTSPFFRKARIKRVAAD